MFHQVKIRFLTAVLLTILSGPVLAADYWVAPDGDDDNAGSAAYPWQTISHAAVIAAAGDTVHVLPGTYAESVRFVNPGSAGALIRFVAEGAVTVDASGSDWGLFVDGYEDENGRYVELDGFTVTGAGRGGIRISWANGTVIRNCVSHGNGRWGIFTDYADDIQLLDNICYDSAAEHGIYVSNSGDRPVIRGNICYSNNASGIQINADPQMPGDGITSEALVENNICYDNGSAGGAAINLASVRDSVIRNNLLFGNHAGGIAGWGDGNGPDWGCRNNAFVNNTVVFDSGDGRWCISLKEGSVNAVILNNILIGGRSGALEFSTESLSGMQSDYNIMHSRDGDTVVTEEDVSWWTLPQWQSGGRDAHTINAAPGVVFDSEGLTGYGLRTGSPAVDSGAEMHAAIPATDRIGFPRCDDPGSANTGEGSGITDRGCHERCEGMATPTPGATATPGPTQPPTPTYTPLPVDVGVELMMPAQQFHPGETCWCRVTVSVDGTEALSGHPLVVILDVYGVYFFAPGFTTAFDSYLGSHPDFYPGATQIEVIPAFSWPSGAGSASGIAWYAGVCDPLITTVVSNVATFEFGWSD